MIFRDRADAGRRLARALAHHAGTRGVVYPLPRGGVVLGVEIATALGWPIDLVIPRKIGHPVSPEYAIAAVVESGALVGNPEELARVDADWLEAVVARERIEARRRRLAYLGERAPLPLAGATAMVVDDGIATGLTMLAAVRELGRRGPGRLVVAVPVAPRETAERIGREVDEFVALDVPDSYRGAVGAYYEDFAQVSDAEVVTLLAEARPGQAPDG